MLASGRAEREKIVEWIRDFANGYLPGYAAMRLIADCIERGQHVSEDPLRGEWGWCECCNRERREWPDCDACARWFRDNVPENGFLLPCEPANTDP